MIVRFAQPRDAAALASIYAPFVADTSVSFEEVPPDAAEFTTRIDSVTGRLPWLVADDGTIAGFAYASDHRARAGYRWSVDVSAYFDERYRRMGLASQLYEKIFRLLVAQGYVNALAGVALPNDASVGFHKRAGFEPIGTYHHIGFKLGAWIDVMWLEKALQPCPIPPPDPVRLDALARDRIDAILAGTALRGS